MAKYIKDADAAMNAIAKKNTGKEAKKNILLI